MLSFAIMLSYNKASLDIMLSLLCYLYIHEMLSLMMLSHYKAILDIHVILSYHNAILKTILSHNTILGIMLVSDYKIKLLQIVCYLFSYY